MMKGWIAVLGICAAAAAAEYGIASYFFRRTMIRQNATTERTMDMAGTDWNAYLPKIGRWKKQMLALPHEDVTITASDGLKLHGTYFPGDGGKKIVICFHGYTSNGISGFIGLSGYYQKHGYQMLLVDQRAHGDSEGTYIGFGCLDRRDAMQWITYAEQLVGDDGKILLHGTSMGGATVLMTSGLKLPSSVKGIISDCAFTSAWEVFAHVLKSQYHMPAQPLLGIADALVKRRAGYSLKECNAAEEVKKAKVPILLIHGDADTFVPCGMCEEIYRNCASDKEKLIINGAGHCESHYKETETYEAKLTEFLEKRGLL